MRPLRVLAAVTAMTAACWGCHPPDRVRLATTTSVDNSGLLEAALPAFTRDTGVAVDVLAVGSGRALELLRRGDVDAALTHDPGAESAFLREAGAVTYRKIMFNDFVLVGPAVDPAGVRAAADAEDAMRRIARSNSLFVSRGDNSGTHSRERLLWQASGAEPAPRQLLDAGQGMAATLRITSERGAYTLTDRATFAQLRPTLRLEILQQGGDALLNTYALLVPQRRTRAPSARRLIEWLTSDAGRHALTSFRIGGEPVFHPWPASAPAAGPDAVPQP